MCIACELGFLIAMDELPDAPPPGFPRRPSRDGADFACDAPPADAQPAPATTPAEDERKS
jgi:hypothetical protein